MTHQEHPKVTISRTEFSHQSLATYSLAELGWSPFEGRPAELTKQMASRQVCGADKVGWSGCRVGKNLAVGSSHPSPGSSSQMAVVQSPGEEASQGRIWPDLVTCASRSLCLVGDELSSFVEQQLACLLPGPVPEMATLASLLFAC